MGPSDVIGVPRRVMVTAVALVTITGIVVTASLVLVGPAFAQGSYLGIVVSATAARALPLRDQVLAGCLLAVACWAGSLLTGETGPLALCLVAAALLQSVFATRSLGAVTLVPALLAFSALRADPSQSTALGSGVLVGVLIVVGIAAAVRLPHTSDPAPWTSALAYGGLLAVGSSAVLGIAVVAGASRPYWTVLALCLLFAPWRATEREILTLTGATAVGAVIAAGLGSLASEPVIIVLVVIGAVLTVAFTLHSRPTTYLLCLTPTVVLATALGDAESSVVSTSTERAGSVALAALAAVLLTSAWRALSRRTAR